MSGPQPPARGGVFAEAVDGFFAAFNASIGFDHRLAPQDLRQSRAHVRMLGKQGILGREACDAILQGLDQVEQRLQAGEIAWEQGLEDIHMHLEAALTELIGEHGSRLHTARSRNDQVATAYRLYLRDATDQLAQGLRDLAVAVVDRAEQQADTLMPGMTHLQAAQPVTLGHHLLAWYEMLRRDLERLADARRRLNRSPLGAAALAGTPHPIDPEQTAAELGFDEALRNSLDAVSDRDFAVELAAALALLMAHLSRFAEELILWMSPRFGWATLPESLCAGSSIMPQKRNPDIAELVRGKSGRVYGVLMALLTLLKAQPLAYNKDLQEDKEGLMDAFATAAACVRAWTEVVRGMEFDAAAMAAAAGEGHSTATDLADALAASGVPFRTAHDLVGQVVRRADQLGKALHELRAQDLQGIDHSFDEGVLASLSPEASVRARSHLGGTAPERVRHAAGQARQELQALESQQRPQG